MKQCIFTLRRVMIAVLMGWVFQGTAQSLQVIPRPLQCKEQQGTWQLTGERVLSFPAEAAEQAAYLQQVVFRSTGFQWRTTSVAKRADVLLEIDAERVPMVGRLPAGSG